MNLGLLRQRSSVLGKELSIEILGYLRSNPYSIASQVARRFDVHIATAAKYLEEMEKCRLVGSRLRRTGRKPAREYYLLADKIQLQVDLTKVVPDQAIPLRLGSLSVRERRNSKVAYDWDANASCIREIIISEIGGERRRAKKVVLDDIEGRFMWNLPLPGQSFESIVDIARRSGISKAHDLDRIEALVEELIGLGIIERQEGG